MKLIRRNTHTSDGWDHGDLDVAFQLFSCGMVWDGNLASKESRDHFVRHGYAVRRQGMQSLTGKGVVVFMLTPVVWRSAWRRWRVWKHNPFIATDDQIQRNVR